MAFRFVSPSKEKQRTAKNYGALLTLIGLSLLLDGTGSQDIALTGILMLIWSGMSWLAHRKTDGKPAHAIVQTFCILVFLASFILVGVITTEFSNVIQGGTPVLLTIIAITILFLIAIFT